MSLNDQSNLNYSAQSIKYIIYRTEVLKSNLCDYNIWILVRRGITITKRNLATDVAFKNWAPFIKCITKIDGTTIEHAGDLHLVMPMYNLLE